MHYRGNHAASYYKCKDHDYIFYPDSWTDHATGKAYEKGYYDENGNRYDAVIRKENDTCKADFVCKYCNTYTEQIWKEGPAPQCPNCGANLVEATDIVIDDIPDNSMVTKKYQVETLEYKIWKWLVEVGENLYIIGCILVTVLTIGLFVYDFFDLFHKKESDTPDSNLSLFGQSVYVQDIDRTLDWNPDYDSYYDPVSDCYIWYNTDVEPAVWQYWYEGISSDYGDYGWMEYEMDDSSWYIEVKKDDWEKLPEKYDTSKLWYITGELAGTSYTKDYNLEKLGDWVMVDDGSEQFKWDDERVAYYVPENKGYLRVNFETHEYTVQYWHSTISPTYSKNGYGGWLEYDYEYNTWYISDAEGKWSKLSEEKTKGLWHIDQKLTGQTGAVFDVLTGEMTPGEVTPGEITSEEVTP